MGCVGFLNGLRSLFYFSCRRELGKVYSKMGLYFLFYNVFFSGILVGILVGIEVLFEGVKIWK